MAQGRESTFQKWVRAPIIMGARPHKMGARPHKMGARPHDDGCSFTGMRARPFGKGALPKSVTMNFNLLIQHTVSRWCSSGCVHKGCGGVDHWLQTEDWALPGFLL